MKERILICPDFDFYLLDHEDIAIGLDELKDRGGKTIAMPELDAWANEMSPIVIASETDQPYYKDWEDFHKRGLALARQLRRRLSSDYDLWYEAPYEDKSGIVPKPIKIEDVFEPVKEEEGGCYIQWMNRDNCKTEELLMAILYFDYYAEDGSTMDTYTICPDGIFFEAAGFGPSPWNLPEEDICMRISKEQYDIWVAQIEGLKKSMFALADGHTYEKENLQTGDVIMTKYGYYKILEVHKDLLNVRARWLYIGEYGIDYHFEEDDDNNWVEDPEELRNENRGVHVDNEVYNMAINMAKKFREKLINELQEYIYQGGIKEDS